MDIESIAVSEIETRIAKTDLLESYVNKKDKMPSWDGSVLVYKTSSKNKDNILGCVPVQIKGHIDSSKPTNKFYKYRMELADINNYRKTGGVVYFVVKISEDGQTIVPYFSVLLPAYLYQIKQISDKQKTKILPLTRLPENKEGLQNIFLDFLTHSNWQSSVQQIGIKSESELYQAGYTRRFFQARISAISDLLETPNYMYFKNAVGAVACGGLFKFDEITSLNQDIKLIVSDKIYATGAVMDMTIDEIKVGFIENNFKIVFWRNKNKIGQINFEPYGALSKIKQGLKFMIEATKAERFSIDNISFCFNIHGVEKQKTIKILSDDLYMLTKISDMLSLLGVQEDLYLDKSSTINSLYSVAGSLLAQQIIKITNVDHTGFIRIMLNPQGECLLLRVEPRAGDAGTYIAIDTFKSYPPIKVTTQKDGIDIEENMCSYFTLLHETDFYKAINFNLDIVHDDMLRFLGTDASRQTVNIILIHYWFKLLKAFDATGQQTFLDKASKLLERIKEMDNINQTLADVLFLNELQIIKRTRPLTDEELNKLNKFLIKSKELQAVVGACLLKDDMVNAKINFDKLDENIKEMFKTYPIYKFWHE